MGGKLYFGIVEFWYFCNPSSGEERPDAERLWDEAIRRGVGRMIDNEMKVVVDDIKEIAWTKSETNEQRFCVWYSCVPFNSSQICCCRVVEYVRSHKVFCGP